MPLVEEILALAGQLAVLTFNIGVLLHMLPVPIRRIKSLAPVMMEDGIFAALLVSLFSTGLYISDYIAAYSGYTLKEVLYGIESFFNNVMNLYISAKYTMGIYSLLPYMNANLVVGTVLPVLLVFSGVVAASLAAIAVITIVMNIKAELAALGVLLYSLPFRLGRSAGASLLAFVLVMNVALHFLPYWLDLVGSAIGTTYLKLIWEDKEGLAEIKTYEYGEYPFWGRVVDARGNPAPYAVVLLWNRTDSFVTRADANGIYIAYHQGLAPGNYRFAVDYMGIRFTSGFINSIEIPNDLDVTYELSFAPYRYDVVAPLNVIFLEPQGIVYGYCMIDMGSVKSRITYWAASVPMYNYTTRFACITPSQKTTLYIAVPRGCAFARIASLDSYLDKRFYVEEVDWYGKRIDVIVYEFTFNETGRHVFEAKYSCRPGSRLVKPSVGGFEETTAASRNQYADMLAIGVAYTTAVFSYLTLSGIAVLDVARFLGARTPSVIVRVRG